MDAMGPLILVTGATGYVGGHLTKALVDAGRRVRCLVRRPDALKGAEAARVHVVCGDALDEASLRAALDGVDTAYYLIHSMAATGSFEEKDRTAARLFGQAARELESAGSSTWEALATRRSCPRICAAARRWARF
jgi:uncharacterized protein YbjT (DUF2867 family)